MRPIEVMGVERNGTTYLNYVLSRNINMYKTEEYNGYMKHLVPPVGADIRLVHTTRCPFMFLDSLRRWKDRGTRSMTKYESHFAIDRWLSANFKFHEHPASTHVRWEDLVREFEPTMIDLILELGEEPPDEIKNRLPRVAPDGSFSGNFDPSYYQEGQHLDELEDHNVLQTSQHRLERYGEDTLKTLGYSTDPHQNIKLLG